MTSIRCLGRYSCVVPGCRCRAPKWSEYRVRICLCCLARTGEGDRSLLRLHPKTHRFVDLLLVMLGRDVAFERAQPELIARIDTQP